MNAEYDTVVIGAGAVGLACAASLARRGLRVGVVERHAVIASETSSRNSGVVHAGIYYPPASLKARLCVEGRERLYARCQREGIAHQLTGKLVIATDPSEERALESIARRAVDAGAGALEHIDGRELARREPTLRGVAALVSPRSGIVDAHALAISYLREAERHGAALSLGHTLQGAEPRGQAIELTLAGGGGTTRTLTRSLVASAGLASLDVARACGIDLAQRGYALELHKGDYFRVSPDAPLPSTALIYPVPSGVGLGVHLTRDLGGRVLAGPDAARVHVEAYDVDADKAALFAEALRPFWPNVRAEHLTAESSGIRIRATPKDGAFTDFVIEDDATHGVSGVVLLVGIDSPGLTASEAIGEHVASIVTG